jgi:hypothetical protein
MQWVTAARRRRGDTGIKGKTIAVLGRRKAVQMMRESKRRKKKRKRFSRRLLMLSRPCSRTRPSCAAGAACRRRCTSAVASTTITTKQHTRPLQRGERLGPVSPLLVPATLLAPLVVSLRRA